MPNPIDTAYVEILPDFGRFGREQRRQLDAAMSDAGRIIEKPIRDGTDRGKKHLDGVATHTRRTFGGLGTAIAAGFAALQTGQFLKGSITAASDLNETISKTQQIFGPAANTIVEFSKTSATALGQTRQAALDGAATFGIFGKSANLRGPELARFSTRLTTLASDLASFHNTKPEEAIEALGAALRGETEPIRRYGVLLDADTIKAEAFALGLVKPTKNLDKIKIAQNRAILAQRAYGRAVKEHGKSSEEALRADTSLKVSQQALAKAMEGTTATLTPQQKILAAQSLIFKQTRDAQGDFARTSAGLANQQRIATAQVDRLKVALGKALLPTVLSVTTALNKSLLPPLIEFTERHGPAISRTLAGIGESARVLVTGDFRGGLFNATEDSRYVDVLLRIHAGVASVYEAARLLVTGDFRGGLFDVEEDSQVVATLLQVRDGIREIDTEKLKEAGASLLDSFGKLAPVVGDFGAALPGLGDLLGVTVTSLAFLAEHTDLLRKLLPYLVAAVIAYKVAQLAANLAVALSLPAKIFEIAVNRQLIRSNRALIASRAAETTTTAAATVATSANTTATSINAVAQGRGRLATLAVAVAQKIATATTLVWTVALKALKIAMFLALGPVGLIVAGIALLVAGIIYAYRHSEKFRTVVNAVGNALKIAFLTALDLVVGAFKFFVGFIASGWKRLPLLLLGPVGLVLFIFSGLPKKIADALGDAAGWLYDKGRDFLRGFLDGAKSFLGGLVDWILRAPVVAVVSPFVRTAVWLLTAGRDFLVGFLNGVAEVAKTIGRHLKMVVFDPLVRFFGGALKWNFNAGKLVIRGLFDGVVAGIRAVGGFYAWWYRTVLAPTGRAFAAAGTWLLNGGKFLIKGLFDGVVAYLRAQAGFANWIWRTAIKPALLLFAKAGAWLIAAGKDLIGGLFSGIVDKMKDVKNWIKTNIYDPIIKHVRIFFGIDSPSKVFADLGRYMIAGLLQGLLTRGNGSAIAQKIFGGMPKALTAMVGKGIFAINQLPAKALAALGDLASVIGGGFAVGDLEKFTYQDKTIQGSTLKKLQRAQQLLGGRFNLLQGSFNTSVAASAGTHAGGGVIDVDKDASSWLGAVSALRHVGFAAWHRDPSQGPWGHHIHAVEIGNPTLSAPAAAQVQSYLGGGTGLAGYQTGAWKILHDHLALIHRGELVAPAAIAKDIRLLTTSLADRRRPTSAVAGGLRQAGISGLRAMWPDPRTIQKYLKELRLAAVRYPFLLRQQNLRRALAEQERRRTIPTAATAALSSSSFDGGGGGGGGSGTTTVNHYHLSFPNYVGDKNDLVKALADLKRQRRLP